MSLLSYTALCIHLYSMQHVSYQVCSLLTVCEINELGLAGWLADARRTNVRVDMAWPRACRCTTHATTTRTRCACICAEDVADKDRRTRTMTTELLSVGKDVYWSCHPHAFVHPQSAYRREAGVCHACNSCGGFTVLAQTGLA